MVMVIVTGISDRWTSWKIGPRRLLIDEKRLWKQDFFFDPARKRLDVRRRGHPNIRSHKRGLEAAPS
jgi:hypothetical protein